MTTVRSGEKQAGPVNPEEGSSASSAAGVPGGNSTAGLEAPVILPYGGMATGHYPTELGTKEVALGASGSGSGGSTGGVAAPVSVQRRDSVMSTGSTFGVGGAGDDDNEDSDDDGREKRSGRRKIRIEYIEDKSRRHITFSKRKAGIMKKAYELSTLTGTQVLLLVASETGHVYTFATPKLQPLITKPEGKNLIQACLNAPDICPPDFGTGMCGYEEETSGGGGGGGKEVASYDERASAAQVNAANSNVSANYAAAMAGLAGLYPGSQAGTAASAAFLNPVHYPAAYAAAQYNAALAAGYWPGAPTGAGPGCSSAAIAGLDPNSASSVGAGTPSNAGGGQLSASQGGGHKPQSGG